MSVYYNEWDEKAAAWLRELIRDGLIPSGDVDTRSIAEVQPDDVRGYTHCHFFAGIGGWAYALQLAGWPADRPVWTGSCPCQPFSAAGKGEGFNDPRHLWPDWFRLISECDPVTVVGEQVPGAVRLGWFDLVSADLEGKGFAVGATVLGSHSVKAFDIRQRLYWVADTMSAGRAEQRTRAGVGSLAGCGSPGGLVDAISERGRGRKSGREDAGHAGEPGEAGRLDDPASARRVAARVGTEGEARHDARMRGPEPRRGPSGFWDAADWIPCRDGKWRPVEPGTFPLAHGIPGRVGRLRGYGNAINPYVAAAFVSAFLDTEVSA